MVTAVEVVAALRQAALALPRVEEGVDCAGTPLECSTFKIDKRTFLFVSPRNARLRLSASRAEAAELAAKEPARFVLGPQGWVKIFLEQPPELALMLRWLDESYRLVMR